MVSIVVPVYNAEKYLHACVESILQQTYRDIECILIDDGSVDNSAAICSDLAAADQRVKYVRQENAGVSSARNHGLALASGEYVLFVDSDDILKSDMVESMIATMEEEGTDCVVCGIAFFTESTTETTDLITPRATLRDKESAARFFAREYSATLMNSPCNKLYKKALIKSDFDTSVDIGEDLLFNLAYSQNVSSISYLDQAFYCYRRNVSGSLSIKLRGDMYAIADRLYKGCMDYLGTFSGPFHTEKISYFHFKNLQLSTLGVVHAEGTKKEKTEALRKICSDNMTVMALEDIAQMQLGKKDKIFRSLMQKKHVHLLYWLNFFWLRLR